MIDSLLTKIKRIPRAFIIFSFSTSNHKFSFLSLLPLFSVLKNKGYLLILRIFHKALFCFDKLLFILFQDNDLERIFFFSLAYVFMPHIDQFI